MTVRRERSRRDEEDLLSPDEGDQSVIETGIALAHKALLESRPIKAQAGPPVKRVQSTSVRARSAAKSGPGFIASTMAVGIRIVAPRSLVVS